MIPAPSLQTPAAIAWPELKGVPFMPADLEPTAAAWERQRLFSALDRQTRAATSEAWLADQVAADAAADALERMGFDRLAEIEAAHGRAAARDSAWAP